MPRRPGLGQLDDASAWDEQSSRRATSPLSVGAAGRAATPQLSKHVSAAVGPITVTDTGPSSASAAAVLTVPLGTAAAGASTSSQELLLSPRQPHAPITARTGREPLEAPHRPVAPAPLPPLAPFATRTSQSDPPGNDDASTEDATDAARLDANFGVALALDADLMLQSDVKSDIVHSFTEKLVGGGGASAAAAARGATGASFDATADASAAPSSGGLTTAAAGTAVTFSVTSYWAMHFHALRELHAGPSREFVESLAFATRWDASGGKSGARFEHTADRRFVIKHVSRTEFDMFVDAIAPAYFQHMRGCASAGLPSFLVKILGAFKVVVSGASPAGPGGGGAGAAPLLGSAAGGASRRVTSYVVVMEDLFAGGAQVPAGMKFDLKGKLRAQKRPPPPPLPAPPPQVPSRHAPSAPREAGGAGAVAADGGVAGAAAAVAPESPTPLSDGSGLVLFDGDFLSRTGGHPLPVDEGSKRLLEETLRRDCEFLTAVRVIDYSLLVGLDPSSGSLTVGLIDYLRRFDLAKQIESRVKTVTQLVTNVDPTILQPERYASRLQRAVLDKYFTACPGASGMSSS